MEELFAGRAQVTSSKSCYIDFMEPGVDKWSAVKIAAGIYKIKPDEIMCIGDSNNDLPMIRGAGVGVAVENASDEAKGCADHIVASNDDSGVAEAIGAVLDHRI